MGCWALEGYATSYSRNKTTQHSSQTFANRSLDHKSDGENFYEEFPSAHKLCALDKPKHQYIYNFIT